MIFIILLILFVNIIFCLHSFVSYINPGSIFGLGFFFATLMCVWYYREWQISIIHAETLLILGLGIPLYSMVCKLVDKPYIVVKRNNISYSFSNTFLYLCILFQLFAIAITLRSLMQVTGSADLTLAITMFREQKDDAADSFQLPLFVRNLAWFAQCLGYYFSYALARMIVEKKQKKQIILSLIIFVLGTIICLRAGSRGDFVLNVLGFVFFLNIFKMKFYGQRIKLKLGQLIKYFSVGIVLLYAFFMSMTFLGNRDSSTIDPLYGFGVYCGAEIKNLDLYIEETNWTSPIFAKYTLERSLTYQEKSRFLKYRYVNGYSLGNVNTCFQNYYKDFGFFGVFLVIIFIAFIMQNMYNEALRSRNVFYNFFDWKIFIFVFFAQRLAFSFFAERFFMVCQWTYIKSMIFVYIISMCAVKYGLIKNIKNE